MISFRRCGECVNSCRDLLENEGTVTFGNGATSIRISDSEGFFRNFVYAMGDFFETGRIPAPHEETLEVIKIIEAGEKAMKKPFTWIGI